MGHKKGMELSIGVLIKLILGLLVLVVLILILMGIGGQSFSAISTQMKNAIASLTNLELFK